MDIRVIRSWDGLPVGEIVSLDEKQAYSAVIQGRAEYVQIGEQFHEMRVLKEWQGISPGAIVQRTRGVGSVLVTLGVAEWVIPWPEVIAPVEPPSPEGEPDLSTLTAKDLKVIAKERGIEFAANASKEKMLELLTPHLAPPSPEGEPDDEENAEGGNVPPEEEVPAGSSPAEGEEPGPDSEG